MGHKELEDDTGPQMTLQEGSSADKPTEQESRGAQRGCDLEGEEREGRANSECHLECTRIHVTETLENV